MTFSTPSIAIPGFNPDPSVCQAGDDYFLATSTFEYTPGVPIYHSRDLSNWELIGHALTRPSQLLLRGTEAGGGVFAPTLRYHKGRFYMATSVIYNRRTVCADSRGFYVWTDDIFNESSWSDPVYFDQLGIDQDPNASPADLSAAIFTSDIDLATGRSLSTPVMLRESPSRCAEGPHIYRLHGWYYLLTAEGGTFDTSSVYIYRSKSPLGPYEAGPNPIVSNGAHHPTVRNTNHADWVQDKDGNWIIFFIACRMQAHGGAPLARETFYATMVFDEDGWPVVNGGKMIELATSDGILAAQKPVGPWREDFSSGKSSFAMAAYMPVKALSLGWYRLRTPVKADYSLTDRPGWLTIRGNAWRLQDLEAPAVLLRKQYAPAGTWSTLMDFNPTTANVEAGSTIYWSCYAYGAILIRRGETEGSRVAVLRWTAEEGEGVDGSTTREITHEIPGADPVELRITATPTTYRFSYRSSASSDGKPVYLGEISAWCLERSGPNDSPYTGPLFGIFSQGRDAHPCLESAHFKYVSFD